jgi:hypothetical protein
MLRPITFFLLLCVPPAFALEVESALTTPVSLAELAAAADLVVVAQARDTDYFLRREIPVSGSAYLKVLISYKADGPLDIVEVYEKGLHAHECYFPNPTVFEEGRRYLLFLKQDPDDETRYRGLPQGCALDVLVDDKNGYALRYPVSGISLSDPLGELATEMRFSDGYAVVDEANLLPAERDAMHSSGEILPHSPDRWIYTRGIPLTRVRELMGVGNLAY